MKGFVRVIQVFLVGWAAYLLIAPFAAPVQAEATAPGPDPEVVAAKAAQRAAYELETQARIQNLARIENQRNHFSRLTTQGEEIRTELLMAKSAAWSALITTNWQAYQNLRQKAAGLPGERIACTFCDGRGAMDYCLVCGHTKQCVTCNGSGKAAFNETCPTCRGKGICYFCFGSGKMPCPFCDDGTIYLSMQPPSPQIPR